MSEVKVNKISPRSGTAITLGDSGDTFTIPSGATLAIAGSVTGFTSAGIDDNATSVAITIDSSENVGIKNTTPSNFNASARQLVVGSGSGDNGITIFAGTSNNSSLFLADGTTATNGFRGSVNYLHNGDALTLHANATETMRLTNGKVGIGTSSITAKLQVTSASSGGTPHASADELAIENSANTGINILSGASHEGAIYFGDSSDNDIGRVRYNHSTNAMDFTVNASVRATIDSSGNFFVATTTEASDDVGHALLASGAAYHTTDGTYAGLFNRKSSDGGIVQIRKDNTVVGTIGVNGDNLVIDCPTSAHTGLDFANDKIIPRRNSAASDNTVDLGFSGGRFKDIYLGGGAFIGGTGTANKLNDFEQGTWTPIYRTTGNQLSSVTYNSLTGGEYTKVGQLVTCTGAIASDAVTLGSPSGNLRLGGLPFTVKTVGSTTATRGGVAMSNQLNWGTNHTPNNAYVIEGTTEIDLKLLYGNNDDADPLASTDILTGSNTSANRLFFTLSYMTDA